MTSVLRRLSEPSATSLMCSGRLSSRAVAKAHSHAAEPDGRYLQIAFSKSAFLHCFSFRTVSLIPRLGSNAEEAVARSFRFIAYSSRYVKKHWCFRSGAAILDNGRGNQYNEKPQQKRHSDARSST